VLCGDDWEADEIAQETFLQAMKTHERFQQRSTLRTWLTGICVNVHRNRFRAAVRRLRRYKEFAVHKVTNTNSPPSKTCLEEEEYEQQKQRIWAIVRRLPTKQAEVIVLKYAEEMTIAEMTAVLNCPAGTVKSRLHHAMTNLRLLILDQCDEPPARNSRPDQTNSNDQQLVQPATYQSPPDELLCLATEQPPTDATLIQAPSGSAK